MDNKERLFWLSGIILLAFYSMNQINHIESLEILDRNHALSYRIQNDQINELDRKLVEVEKQGYKQGFADGESHALITSMNGKNLYDYADGYHAALLQFTNEKKPNIDQDTYGLFLNLLETLDQSESNYNELLDTVSDEN